MTCSALAWLCSGTLERSPPSGMQLVVPQITVSVQEVVDSVLSGRDNLVVMVSASFSHVKQQHGQTPAVLWRAEASH